MLPVLPSTKRHHIHLDNNNSTTTPAAQQSNGNKRSASMIFRIEQLLPPTVSSLPPAAIITTIAPPYINRDMLATAATTPTTARRSTSLTLHQRSGVYVSQFTPKDTLSESVSTISLMSLTTPLVQQQHQSTRTYCRLVQETLLCISPAILRKIKLSEDTHSNNALFELDSERNVRLRIVRDIAEKDEIVAWFGEEMSMFMSIPFLTPMHIQGNKRYTCHICHLTFETPNPLKIHLALGCGHNAIDILWVRLHYALKTTSYTTLSMQPSLTTLPLVVMEISPATASSSANSSLATLTTSSPESTITTATTQRFSAFKAIPPSAACSNSPVPVTTFSTVPTCITHSMPLTLNTSAATSSNSTLSFMPSLSSVTLPPLSMLQPSVTNPLNAAAQIEAIVSNMGASKQGHLCIYCGKVYSRKYGLKIHIRTHTGFKPLKCKFCLRPFGDPSNLNKHVRLHLQTSSDSSSTSNIVDGYKCHLCHKTSARRRDLQRHIEARHANAAPDTRTLSRKAS